jgi:hypothetical protein
MYRRNSIALCCGSDPMIVDQSNQNSVEKKLEEKHSSMRRPSSTASGVSESRAR